MATPREEAFDHRLVPAAEYVLGSTLKEHLWNAGTDGEHQAQQGFFTRLLEKGFPKYGDGGEVVGGTNVLTEIGWIATNFWRVMQALGRIEEILKKLALGQGVTIDYDEIARKVADEQARRLTAGSIDLEKEG